MTYKSDDLKFLNEIIEWCKKKKDMGEYDSEVQKLYELACEARPYLLGKTLDEQKYCDQYKNKIMDLAVKFGICSKFDRITAGMRKPASTSPVHEYSGDDIKLSAENIRKLNIKMGRSTDAIDRRRADAGFPTNYNCYER